MIPASSVIQVSGWWRLMCGWVWPTVPLIHIKKHFYSTLSGAGAQVLSTVTLLIQFYGCQSNRRGASASPVTHGRCSHLMEFAASPAGSGLCPPNCNHGPMLSRMSCPHRRWESETGRLVLTGEITISKPINIFTISLREEKQENELTFFFFCLKGLRINYREEEALSSNTPLQIPLIKGGKFISSKNSWFRLTLAFPKLRLWLD